MKSVEAIVPRARPAATGLGVLVALLWVALAVVAIRELTVGQGWATGESWLPAALDALQGRTADVATAALGGLVALLGLVVLCLALKPGRATHLATTDDHDVWLSRGALAALAHGVVDRQAGVVSVDARSTRRRRVTVRVVARDDRAGVEQRVRTALAARVEPLTRQRFAVDVEEVAR